MKKEFVLGKFIKILFKNWVLFGYGILIAIVLSVIGIRYSLVQYEAKAKIEILQDKSSTSELSVFKDLDLVSQGNTKVEDEIEIIMSRTNLTQVVKRLNLTKSFFIKGQFRDTELYKGNYPFSINFLSNDSLEAKNDYNFEIDIISENDIQFRDDKNNIELTTEFGNKIETPIGVITLIPNEVLLRKFKGETIVVSLISETKVVDRLLLKVKVFPADKLSNIVNFALVDPIEERAIDILDEIIFIYNANGVADRKAVADKTSQFINERISDIYSNLSDVDETAEAYKEQRGIADLGSQSSVNFQQSAVSQQELQNARTQLSIASNMKNIIDDQSGFEIIPEVGLSDPAISGAAQRYNQLVSERKRLLQSSTEKSPVVQKIDEQLRDLKTGMKSSLNNVTNNLNLEVNGLSRQLNSIQSRIYAAPGQERALRDISRKQQTTEALYLYLLQKREESQITFASSEPNSKVINFAHGNGIPVSPKPLVIFFGTFLLGLTIPFLYLYINYSFIDKVENMLGLQNKLGEDYTVLGEIPYVVKGKTLISDIEDRSVLAESLRIIRTNLDYILKKVGNGDHQNNKMVLVTSSIPGEGKSFVSTNLCLVYASANKKVLLIGADIRNPRIPIFEEEEKKSKKGKPIIQRGLTEYLHGDVGDFKEIINQKTLGNHTFDVIYSGKIPPNPSELLLNGRFSKLLENVNNNYDYIIIDSAPIMAVTDTSVIAPEVNQVVYVTRSDYTDYEVLDFPKKLISEGKLKKVAFVVNGVKESELGYGGKYGYGYGRRELKWYQKLNPKNW